MRRFCVGTLVLMLASLFLAGLAVTLIAPPVRVGSQENGSAELPLDRKVAIYVPGTVDISKLSPQLAEKMTQRALERFAEMFGGATLLPATGAWMSKDGLVKEPVQIVYSFTRQDTLKVKVAEVLALARELCEQMRQQSVCLEIDGRLYFVERNTQSLPGLRMTDLTR
jgi:hypothetical protein